MNTISNYQEVYGMIWRYLGEFYFETGTGGHVTLIIESSDTGQAVIADAVRFGGGMGSIDRIRASVEPRGEKDVKKHIEEPVQ
ncbi:hypothetical protein ACFLV7_03690 [Chloroflexota bacterium]